MVGGQGVLSMSGALYAVAQTHNTGHSGEAKRLTSAVHGRAHTPPGGR